MDDAAWMVCGIENVGAWGNLHLGGMNFPKGSVRDPVDKRAAMSPSDSDTAARPREGQRSGRSG